MKTKGNHPLAELLAKKLSGIETVPRGEQPKMVNRAAKAAVAWHESEIAEWRRIYRKAPAEMLCMDCARLFPATVEIVPCPEIGDTNKTGDDKICEGFEVK